MSELSDISNKKSSGNLNANDTSSKTQCKMILTALRNGERLTHLDAEQRFRCLRLGARIYDLKQQGHDIQRRMITVPSGKRVAEYFMNEVVE
ncbi:helix-turn-helix domain-containing protein [Basfia succiniciproducens]|uniref:helix-turn-helix domain-containing protein n=1 Tax=Basfia succiniciproducens TaxID=653940 RepID=UPI0008AB90D0|nr:helix-turn-helix domain-containing protein [Basfia succiniciproducens]SEQ77230.1 Helix-turn-helix domain-containing protein [Basfia succiniciproducens]